MAEENEGIVDGGQIGQSRVEELMGIFDEVNAEEEEKEEVIEVAEEETEEVEVEDTVEETEDEIEEEAPVEAASEEEIPDIPAPAAFSGERAAQWDALDNDTKTYLVEQFAQRDETASQTTERLKALDNITASIEPMRQQLALNGVDEATYVRQLVAADQLLRTQPQEALKWIAQQYGVSLDSMNAEEDEYADPALTPVINQVSQLQSQLAQMQQAQQQSEIASATAQIEAFGRDKPHFEAVRAHMGALMQSNLADDLQSAYDQAVYANPTTRAALQAESAKQAETQRQAAQKEKVAKAKKISDTNLSSKGTAGGQTPPEFASRTDELLAIYDEVTGAV